MDLTCPKVPIPNKATPIPKKAKILASQFKPSPFLYSTLVHQPFDHFHLQPYTL